MKISGDEFLRAITVQRTDTSRVNKSAAVTPVSTPKPVEFSETARQIQKVKKELDTTPDVREEMVANLKARIDAGTYNVSSDEIADLMIRRNNADRIE